MKKNIGLTFILLFIFFGIKAQENTKPNIIIILADDMGYGDVSAFNPNGRIKTVNIDDLANDGIRFTAGHSTSSVCTPSRYSILTGRYNWRTHLKSGVLNAYDAPLIDSARMTIADILKKNDYNTACIGKWHLGLGFSTTNNKNAIFNAKTRQTNIAFDKPLLQTPNDLGFDYFYGIAASADMPPYMFIENRNFTERYDTIKGDVKFMNKDQSQFFRPGPAAAKFEPKIILPVLTAKAVDYIKTQSSSKPFFLYFPLTAPHTPIAPSDEFKGKSKVHQYLDFCLQVDFTVGEIVKTLKEKDLYKNTIIVFTSDNGYAPYVDVNFLENHGHFPSYIFRGYKADSWEGGHRVPMIIEWPGKTLPNSVCDDVVSLADLFSTVAHITHTHIPDNSGEDSDNLLPIILGEKYKYPLREATVYHSIKGDFCIQKGDWKLILCNEKEAGGIWLPDKWFDNTQANTPYMLYNLKLNPGETINLYDKYPKKVKELKTLLIKYIKDGRSTKGIAQKNDAVKNWPQVNWMKN